MERNAGAVRGRAERARRCAGLVAAGLALGVAGCSSTTTSTATTVATVPPLTLTPTSAVGQNATTTPAGADTAEPTDTAAGTSTESGTVPRATTGTTAPAPTTSTVPPTTTTTVPPTTTLPLFTQGGVVIVANASGVVGAAAAATHSLAGVGFQTVKATNAAGYEDSLDVSKVYFAPDAYPVAYSVAQLMGGVVVAPMPTPPPIVLALDGLRGANVIVMLGKDLAGRPLPGVPAG